MGQPGVNQLLTQVRNIGRGTRARWTSFPIGSTACVKAIENRACSVSGQLRSLSGHPGEVVDIAPHPQQNDPYANRSGAKINRIET